MIESPQNSALEVERNSAKLTWVDPKDIPPKKTSRVPQERKYLSDANLAELRRNPGRWCLLAQGVNGATPTMLKKQLDRDTTSVWKVEVRTNDEATTNPKSPRKDVYVCYVGPVEQDLGRLA
jgi:hypothetical protein